MKKTTHVLTAIVCLLSLAAVLMGNGSGQMTDHVMAPTNDGTEQHVHMHVNVQEVELSEEEQEELSRLYGEAFEKQKEIIDKYVEFGVLDEDHGEKIISRFDHYYSKLKENNFIPKWDKQPNRHEQEQ